MKNAKKTKEAVPEQVMEEKKENLPAENEKTPPAKTLAEKKAEFAKLISGEYKEVYEELLGEKIAKSLNENKALKEKLTQADEILEMLSDRYASSDASDLKKALKADNELFADRAGKYGMDVDSYRYMRNLERENARAKAQLDRSKLEAEMADKMRSWYADSDAISREYPDFNLAEEIDNPKFVELMRSGVDMKTAYEVLHHNDILESIRRENALEAKKKAAMELEARNNRPVENGLSSQSSAVFKKDVSLLTPEERAEIAKRAAKGEIITF